jgi:hypothetical protein
MLYIFLEDCKSKDNQVQKSSLSIYLKIKLLLRKKKQPYQKELVGYHECKLPSSNRVVRIAAHNAQKLYLSIFLPNFLLDLIAKVIIITI